MFKIGDKVRMLDWGGIKEAIVGSIYTVERVNENGGIRKILEFREGYCYVDSWFEKIEQSAGTIATMCEDSTNCARLSDLKIKKTIMNAIKEIPNTIKRLLNPSLQAQYKAGFLNDDLSLSSTGQAELLQLVALDYEEKLGFVAKEIIAKSKKI